MADELTPIGASLPQQLEALKQQHPHEPIVGVQPSGDTVNGCGVCRYGLVHVAVVGGQPSMFACLCRRGQGKRLASIASQLTDDDRERYWPSGAPTTEPQRVLQLLTDARIPPKFLPWSLASYAERFKADRDQQRYVKLAGEWVRATPATRSDLVIYGPNGTGKTGIAIALGRALAELDQVPLFWTMRELAIAWRDTFRPGGRDDGGPTEAEFLDGLVAADLLIVDEVSGQRISEFVEDTLTMIVDKRQRLQRPSILTLNIPADADDDSAVVTQLLGPTLQDRLRERGQFWPMKGLSRRNTYGRQQERSR